MDFSNFKKVKDAGAEAHFKHPDGHVIKIDKRKLNPKLQKSLSEIPLHMDDGGLVPVPNYLTDDPSKMNLPETPQDSGDHRTAFEQMWDNRPGNHTLFNQSGTQDFRPPDQSAQAPQDLPAPGGPQLANDRPIEVPQDQQIPQTPQDQFGFNAYGDNMQAGFGMQLEGMKNEARALGNQGYAEASAARENIGHLQEIDAKYRRNYDDIDKEIQGTIDDASKGHIDPQHIWVGKSGFQKAMVLVGLALGGNPDILKSAIERDVDAQKADMNNKHNILTAQFKRMGNMRDATDMARMVQAGIYADKLKIAASQSQNPLAQARYMRAAGALFQQYAPLAQQVAMRRAMMNGQQAGKPVDPAIQIRALITDPHEQAKANESLGKMEAIEHLRQNVEASARALQKKPLAGALTPGDRHSHLNTYSGILAKLAEGRFNLQEANNQMDALMPSAFDNKKTIQDKALHRRQFFDALRAEHESALRGKGINVPRANVNFDEGAPVK